ncbi:hypothetical protein [Deinococcus hohokamensis]|uniref:Uncharacterized protein n=1 Tax=Deinococcus hohokamensis TaxID=309883 RepID=A0ABV9I7W0_9DEIO
MTAVAPDPLILSANRQTIDTCIALTLQMVAAIEFAPVLSTERPTQELLLDFAEQVERNATDIARMDGHGETDIAALGEDVYRQLTVQREEPLRVAYHALHSAAFLGLEHGLTTATMLSAVAYALRVLARRESCTDGSSEGPVSLYA